MRIRQCGLLRVYKLYEQTNLRKSASSVVSVIYSVDDASYSDDQRKQDRSAKGIVKWRTDEKSDCAGQYHNDNWNDSSEFFHVQDLWN